MKKIRTDYKLNRNQKMYDEYINSDTSYNKLGRKYGISPQRARFIITDLKKKGIGSALTTDSTADDRNKYRDLAIELREQGKLDLSLKMFEEVAAWDEKYKDYRGLDSTYGHIGIVYAKKTKHAKTKNEKLKYMKAGKEYLLKSIALAEDGKLLPGAKVMIQVRLAAAKLLESEFQNKKESSQNLADALTIVEKAIVELPGSDAGKAWPMNIKAKILHKMGRSEEAFQTVLDAQKNIFTGYFDELNWSKYRKKKKENLIGNDQALMKIRIWISNLYVTTAVICNDTHRYALADYFANSVLKLDDPDGTLAEVKKTAKAVKERL